MTRVRSWRLRFEEQIDAIRRNPHQWGTHDCLSGLVAPMVEAITGRVYFGSYLGQYDDAAGALALMRDSGFKNLADVLASELPEVHPSQTIVGDVAAIPSGDKFGFALGIVNGDRVFIMHEDGLGTRDLSETTRAFKVN